MTCPSQTAEGTSSLKEVCTGATSYVNWVGSDNTENTRDLCSSPSTAGDEDIQNGNRNLHSSA